MQGCAFLIASPWLSYVDIFKSRPQTFSQTPIKLCRVQNHVLPTGLDLFPLSVGLGLVYIYWWTTQYLVFKGGVPWCLGAARYEVDMSPELEELSVNDLQMMKLIKADYNREAPPYWAKTTSDDLLLAVGVIESSYHPYSMGIFLFVSLYFCSV